MSGPDRAALLGRLARRLLAPDPLVLSGRTPPRPPRRVVVVSLGDNPTLDYYLRPRLDGTIAALEHLVVSPRADPAASLGDDPQGVFVVFCRYVSRPWLSAIARHRDRLAGVGLLLDDDIEAVIADGSAPLGYRLRLVARHLMHRRPLQGQIDRLWVSTPELARRFPAAAACVLPPVAGRADQPPPARPIPCPAAPVRLAFHATGVHDLEHAWLAPVLARLVALRPGLVVEVIADAARARHWRGIAGIALTGPMSWPGYRAHTATAGIDLMLAPLLDTSVNRCRSPTKRIDAARAGAGLITTAPWVYHPGAEEMALGMSVAHDPDALLAVLVGLVDDPMRIRRLAALNADRVRDMGRAAGGLF